MIDPAGFRCHVFVCTNLRAPDDPRGCCRDKGSLRLRNYMKQRAKEMGLADVRINLAGCLDRCEHGPSVVVYPEGVWYTLADEGAADVILTRHLLGREPVDRLRMPSGSS